MSVPVMMIMVMTAIVAITIVPRIIPVIAIGIVIVAPVGAVPRPTAA